jgi:hypothetical protein
MRILAHKEPNKKNYTALQDSRKEGGYIHTENSTKCQTVAKTEDKQLANLWSNEHVHYHKNLPLL